MKEELKSAGISAFWGVVFLLGAVWFWHYLVGNPFDEFALVTRGQTAPGFIVDTWEDVEYGDEGGTHWFHAAVYKYRLPDGREFTQRTKTNSGPLRSEFRDLTQPYPIEVEYLPDAPAVSRIKGNGSPSVFDWLWRRVGLGGLLLALFLSPGIFMLRIALSDFKKYRQNVRSDDFLRAVDDLGRCVDAEEAPPHNPNS
ncbi:MAG: DUF3592 domain-containing protein [Pirellulaceae bacterium]